MEFSATKERLAQQRLANRVHFLRRVWRNLRASFHDFLCASGAEAAHSEQQMTEKSQPVRSA
jgi:hypothetical protein